MADDLPVYGWGESVTWNAGRLLVPLNREGRTVADLEMDEDEARLLADMLSDAASDGEPPVLQVVHVVRHEGPTSEVFAGPFTRGEAHAWIEANRTDAWTMCQVATLERSAVVRGEASRTLPSEGPA